MYGGEMIYSCEKCGETCTDKGHHKFSQTKSNLKKYGAHLIHHPKNIKHLCHSHHNKLEPGDKFTEREFIREMELLEYCKGKIGCFLDDFPSETKCKDCRDYQFDKEFFYEINNRSEKFLIPGSYGYKE